MVSVGIPDESELMKGEAPTKRKKKIKKFWELWSEKQKELFV